MGKVEAAGEVGWGGVGMGDRCGSGWVRASPSWCRAHKRSTGDCDACPGLKPPGLTTGIRAEGPHVLQRWLHL